MPRPPAAPAVASHLPLGGQRHGRRRFVLDDELGGRLFVAVLAVGGKGFYVQVEPEIGETVRESDTIRVGFEVEQWVKPADLIIARFAHSNGGVYDPARHKASSNRFSGQRLVPPSARPRSGPPRISGDSSGSSAFNSSSVRQTVACMFVPTC